MPIAQYRAREQQNGKNKESSAPILLQVLVSAAAGSIGVAKRPMDYTGLKVILGSKVLCYLF